MKTLNIKLVDIPFLEKMWGFTVILPSNAIVNGWKVYVRCNAKGDINWDKTATYNIKELIERNNVNIL